MSFKKVYEMIDGNPRHHRLVFVERDRKVPRQWPPTARDEQRLARAEAKRQRKAARRGSPLSPGAPERET